METFERQNPISQLFNALRSHFVWDVSFFYCKNNSQKYKALFYWDQPLVGLSWLGFLRVLLGINRFRLV